MKEFPLSSCFFIVCLLYHGTLIHAAKLILYCGSIENFTETELDEPLTLLDSECYNEALPTKIYAFGFTEGPNGPDATSVVKAYLTIGKYNVFVVDWQKEAASPPLLKPIGYAVNAVPNTKKVGEELGKALIKMAQKTLDLLKVHLIGHSLGAHLMGYCGKEVQTSNQNVSRITGLDPAGPLFDGIVSLDGLNPSRASFVDIRHTDPGRFGSNEQLGHVDIWFNCNSASQPNCVNKSIIIERDNCNHQESWRYFVKAILDPDLYTAEYSDSCVQWLKSRQDGIITRTVSVGDDVDQKATGNFFLATTADSTS